MRRAHDLDAKDREILALLELDSRRPNSEVARLTGLSAPTVAERIARLRDIGVIRGFGVRIDSARIGLPVTAIVEFRPYSQDPEQAVRMVSSYPWVRDCFRVTGQAFLMFSARVPNHEVLNTMLDALSHHGETRTSIVLQTEFRDRPYFAETQDSR